MKFNKLEITNQIGELDVVYKYKADKKNRPIIRSSNDAIQVIEKLFKVDKLGLQEQFVVVFLNRANRVIGSAHLFSGGITSTVVDIRIVVATALRLLSSAIIVAHNHPSGNLSQSVEDKKLTQKLKEALDLMEIKLLDHIILGQEQEYYSFADTGEI